MINSFQLKNCCVVFLHIITYHKALQVLQVLISLSTWDAGDAPPPFSLAILSPLFHHFSSDLNVSQGVLAPSQKNQNPDSGGSQPRKQG